MQILDLPDETLFDILNFIDFCRPIIAVVCRRWNDVICGRTSNKRRIKILDRSVLIGRFLEEYCDYIDFEDDYFQNLLFDKVIISKYIELEYFKLLKRILQNFKIKDYPSDGDRYLYEEQYVVGRFIRNLTLGRIYINMASNSKFHYNRIINGKGRIFLKPYKSSDKYIEIILNHFIINKKKGDLIKANKYKDFYIYFSQYVHFLYTCSMKNSYFKAADKEIYEILFNSCTERGDPFWFYKDDFDKDTPITKGLIILYECYSAIYGHNLISDEKIRNEIIQNFVNKKEDIEIRNNTNYLIELTTKYKSRVEIKNDIIGIESLNRDESIEGYIKLCKDNTDEVFKKILVFLQDYVLDKDNFYGSKCGENLKKLFAADNET
jgi:hypothetical protein